MMPRTHTRADKNTLIHWYPYGSNVPEGAGVGWEASVGLALVTFLEDIFSSRLDRSRKAALGTV